MEKIVFTKNMTETERVDAIKAMIDSGEYKVGTFTSIEYTSEKGVRKSYIKEYGETKVEKKTSMVVSLGKAYSETKAFKELQREVQPLSCPYEYHVKGYENILTCVERPGQEPYYKLRVFLNPNPSSKTKSEYYLNGEPITKAELDEKGCLLAESKPDTMPIMITIKVANINSL